MEALAAYRHTQFRGVEELTRAAAALVERFSAEATRANLRSTITERTVRHYLSEELLGQPRRSGRACLQASLVSG